MIAPVPNPFAEIMAQLAEINDRLDRIERAAKEPQPEWEPISLAMKRRHKSRATLLAAVMAGQVNRRIEPSPGGERYLLRIADLDRVYPVLP